jgi:hypothetical protein
VSQWATMMKYRAMAHYYRKTRGRLYESLYRMTMGGVAIFRLALLASISPFGDFVWNRRSQRFALDKWKVVLGWALGRLEVAPGD